MPARQLPLPYRNLNGPNFEEKEDYLIGGEPR